MERIISDEDFSYYTRLKQILFDLELENKEYWWLISDIDICTDKDETFKKLSKHYYLLISTSELLKMLEEDDFQWVWAVFSVIPFHHTKEEILDVPFFPSINDFYNEDEYNPYYDEPKLQHPLAEFELYAVDSSCMFLVSDDEELLDRFKKCYPNFKKSF